MRYLKWWCETGHISVFDEYWNSNLTRWKAGWFSKIIKFSSIFKNFKLNICIFNYLKVIGSATPALDCVHLQLRAVSGMGWQYKCEISTVSKQTNMISSALQLLKSNTRESNVNCKAWVSINAKFLLKLEWHCVAFGEKNASIYVIF